MLIDRSYSANSLPGKRVEMNGRVLLLLLGGVLSICEQMCLNLR